MVLVLGGLRLGMKTWRTVDRDAAGVAEIAAVQDVHASCDRRRRSHLRLAGAERSYDRIRRRRRHAGADLAAARRDRIRHPCAAAVLRRARWAVARPGAGLAPRPAVERRRNAAREPGGPARSRGEHPLRLFRRPRGGRKSRLGAAMVRPGPAAGAGPRADHARRAGHGRAGPISSRHRARPRRWTAPPIRSPRPVSGSDERGAAGATGRLPRASPSRGGSGNLWHWHLPRCGTDSAWAMDRRMCWSAAPIMRIWSWPEAAARGRCGCRSRGCPRPSGASAYGPRSAATGAARAWRCVSIRRWSSRPASTCHFRRSAICARSYATRSSAWSRSTCRTPASTAAPLRARRVPRRWRSRCRWPSSRRWRRRSRWPAASACAPPACWRRRPGRRQRRSCGSNPARSELRAAVASGTGWRSPRSRCC